MTEDSDPDDPVGTRSAKRRARIEAIRATIADNAKARDADFYAPLDALVDALDEVDTLGAALDAAVAERDRLAAELESSRFDAAASNDLTAAWRDGHNAALSTITALQVRLGHAETAFRRELIRAEFAEAERDQLRERIDAASELAVRYFTMRGRNSDVEFGAGVVARAVRAVLVDDKGDNQQ